jgi:cell division protein FtsI/penicillin-binding protein 2
LWLAVALSSHLVRAEKTATAPLPAPLLSGSITTEAQRCSGKLQDGTHAELTLDPELQRSAGKLLAQARPLSGAVLVVEVATGNLLVYEQYVRPGTASYDVLTAEAPSASVFKLITTAALFEHAPVDLQTQVCFSGGERQILREHLDPPTGAAPCAPFSTALGFSRNAVYAQLVTQHLMRDDLARVAEQWGFNRPLAFDVLASVGSLILPYNDLQFARAAAGFTASSLSPVGAAHLAYTVALGGRSARMRLIRSAGPYTASSEPDWLGRSISANTAWRLTRMMEVTVHSGTSLSAFSDAQGTPYLPGIRVAGKTGTLRQPSNGRTTMWFTGFAPSRDPKFVVTVLLQNDDVWRAKANEVARDVLRVLFADHKGVSNPLELARR